MKKKSPLERWHGAHHYSNKIHLALLAFLFLAVGTLLFSYIGENKIADLKMSKYPQATPTHIPIKPSDLPGPEGSVCTLDAKQCADGSYVPRVAPGCNFAPCPAQTISPTPKSTFCGGIAGIECPTGYRCQLDGNFPDAGGKCRKIDN